MKSLRKIKVGIDVGGTFTHAVAVDISDYSIIGKACVPTTHKAEEGVAAGVIHSLNNLLKESKIEPDEIVLIAHSTTQATNALLEGDVASVGIVMLGSGVEGKVALRGLTKDVIQLTPGKILPTSIEYLATENPEDSEIELAINRLLENGAQVIAATSLYGPDHPEIEDRIVAIAQARGLIATAASRISQLYGLRVRTRTAVINASMMPRMLDTANLTEQAVKNSGIKAPLMIMRSDGGIMDINEMRKRPILTMLSGPAAGIAAAIMYARVSDGIFMEVGGTSTDISVIRNGKPQIRSAQIGGNRLYLNTLDVRTLGVAGGSIPRVSEKGNILDVGPRSAHIAALEYPAYSQRSDFSDTKIEQFQPRTGDPDDYLIIRSLDDQEGDYCLTPTEAASYLDLIQVAGHGEANRVAVKSVLEKCARKWQTTALELAQALLHRAATKIEPVLQRLKREYKLEEGQLKLIGGGGGAAALVPFCAEHMDWPHEIVQNTEVVSAIGAALGIIRDMVERSSTNPTDTDLLAIRQEASASVQAMGADPESIEVTVEIDARNKTIRAIATGSSDMRIRQENNIKLDTSDLKDIAVKSLGFKPDQVTLSGSTRMLKVFSGEKLTKKWLGMGVKKETRQRVIDPEGIIRLQLSNAHVIECVPANIRTEMAGIIQEYTVFGDAGALLPDIFLLVSGRILDLCGLIDASQVQALLDVELKDIPDDEPLVFLSRAKQ